MGSDTLKSKLSAVANFAAGSVSDRIYLKTFDFKSGDESAKSFRRQVTVDTISACRIRKHRRNFNLQLFIKYYKTIHQN